MTTTKEDQHHHHYSYDAIIVGAGISGISAAHYFQQDFPGKTFRILERRSQLGGTWDLFDYPGIRSDSDMYTFGFSWRPWRDGAKVIADKESILQYLHETVQDEHLDNAMEFGTHIQTANFDRQTARWTLTTSRTAKTIDGGTETTTTTVRYQSQFLFLCTGYYSYDQAYVPDFPGANTFQGPIVHPQFWPKDLDYKDKNIVVIGSGATAVTLVPALTATTTKGGGAKHVTMLQRSPTYIVSQPAEMGILPRLIATVFGHGIARWFFILRMMLQYHICRWIPETAKNTILHLARKQVGEEVFQKEDFTPRYNPWDQRLCVCPGGDFFQALKQKRASIVTDHIVEFTKTGIKLEKAQDDELPADIIVTATGLSVLFAGGITISVDQVPIQKENKFVYKGFMLHDVPNLFVAGGYTNASWTLKVDLTHKCACRLVQHMEHHNYKMCEPKLPGNGESKMEKRPLIDLTSGYVQRRIDEFPKQSTHIPWRLYQNYLYDKYVLEYTALEDDFLAFL